MVKQKQYNTVSEIIVNNKAEILEDWVQNTIKLGGTRVMDLMGEDELRRQSEKLLDALAIAFGAEQYTDITKKEFESSVTILREVSASRARQDFTASETATYIFAIKDALLKFLQVELAGNPEFLNLEIAKINKLIDQLGLITFETYATTREEIISEQSRSLLDLSTPIIKLWDDVLLLPLVGIIDTARSRQVMEVVLNSIVQTESLVVIVDVTGVPIIDTQVAQSLLKTSTAARMLGVEIILTGISVDAAITMTKLDIDWGNMITRGTLRAGVAEAFSMVNLVVVPGKDDQK